MDKIKNEEILEVLEGEKFELGKCPYCKSINYIRDFSELVNDYCVFDCQCEDCQKDFSEYFSLDEVRFAKDEDKDEYYTNSLKSEKDVLIKAMELLIKQENGKNDYSRILTILKNGCYKEDL